MEEIILELYFTWVKDVQRFNTREKISFGKTERKAKSWERCGNISLMGKQVDDVGQQKEGNCCPRSIVMMERNRQNYDSEF